MLLLEQRAVHPLQVGSGGPGTQVRLDPVPTTARDGSPLTPPLSAKDAAAPTLAEATAAGLLPRHPGRYQPQSVSW